MSRRFLTLTLGLALITLASPVRGDTLFANPGPANNGLTAGGAAIFFDLEALSAPITVTHMTSANSGAAGAVFSVEVFTRTGSGLGGPVGSGPGSSPAGWTSLGTVPAMQGPVGSGVSELIDIPDIMLTPGGVTGVAVLFNTHGPRYFGTGSPPLETYQDANLRIVTGDSRSAPFTTGGTWFSSRALVGQLDYMLSALGGSGSATPNPVPQGCDTLLSVTVFPDPGGSTGIQVVGDLSAFGGSATQAFTETGPGTNIFTYNLSVPAGQTVGPATIATTITDNESHTGNANINLTVASAFSIAVAANPATADPGAQTLLTADVDVPACATSTGHSVSVDLSQVGGSASQTMFDDGSNGDVTGGDGVFSYLATVGLATPPGSYILPVTASDAQGHNAAGNIQLGVGAFFEAEPNDNKAQANPVNGIMNGQFITGTTTGAVTTPGPTSVDLFRVKTAAAASGIYRHRLTITTSGTAGHTGTIRGLNQTGTVGVGGTPGTTDSVVQTSLAAVTGGLPARTNQWYGFGNEEEIYYRVAGTATTTSPYVCTLESTPVTPTEVATTFRPGNVTITTVGQGHTTDTDMWLYDSNLNAIPGAGNDDHFGGGTLGSELIRNLGEGVYYLALSNFQFANNQPAAADDDFVTGVLLDFPDAAANSSSTLNVNVAFAVSDSNGNSEAVPATRPGPFDVLWFKITVSDDLAGQGSADPSNVAPGCSTLLTVEVAPDAMGSTGITVEGDLTPIGGSANQAFTETAPGSNVFTYNATIPGTQALGAVSIMTTIDDLEGHTATESIDLTIANPMSPTGAASPNPVGQGGTTLLTVDLAVPGCAVSTGHSVSIDLSPLGGSATQTMYDDGSNGDVTAGDLIFSYSAAISATATLGPHALAATASDAQGHSANTTINLVVQPAGATPVVLPNANETVAGNGTLNTAIQNGARTYQMAFNVSELGGVPNNAKIVGMAFRLAATAANATPWPDALASFTNYDVTLAKMAPGVTIPTMSTTFANNMDGADAVQVRSGPMTIPLFSFPGGALAPNVNMFNEAIIYFPTHYTYTGGDLVIYLTHTGNGQAGAARFLDSLTTAAAGNATVFRGLSNATTYNAPTGTFTNTTITRILWTPGALSGSGSATPSDLAPGCDTLLSVTVNPDPMGSTGITVEGDLTPIGGSATQAFTETAPGSNVFTYNATIPGTQALGAVNINTTIEDLEGHIDTELIQLNIVSSLANAAASAAPSPAGVGQSVTFSVNLNIPSCAVSTGNTVTGDFSTMGGLPNQAFADQGGGLFTHVIVAPAPPCSNYSIPITAMNAQGHTANMNVSLAVVGPITATLFDNGPLITHPGGGFNGADASMLQNTVTPETPDPMNTLGAGHQVLNNNRVADDFVVCDPAGWNVSAITFFAYQTGSTTTSTITSVRLRIWDGIPQEAGSNIVFGDLTTNRLLNSTWSGIYRSTLTNPLASDRPIMANEVCVGTTLPPGHYWLDWQMDGTLASGPWAPVITRLGQPHVGNARQSLAGAAYNPSLDTGLSGVSAYRNAFAFVIKGDALPYVPGDMNCDNALNGLDIQKFTDVVTGASTDPGLQHIADVNTDGLADFNDVAPYVTMLLQ